MAVAPYANISLPPTLSRPSTVIVPPGEKTPSFLMGPQHKSYKHQYSNIYFARLLKLRSFVEANAKRRWNHLPERPVYVPRALEVEKGRLCYIIGTIYMDMPLKPNVMEDIARDQSIPSPAPPIKIFSSDDHIMLEDESGRIGLVGDRVKDAKLVTGVIVGALGMETPGGEFEVIDLCYPEMAPQPTAVVDISKGDEMDVDESPNADASDEWIAAVSGLDIGAPSSSDAQIQMLTEYLIGEGGNVDDQINSANISRLIIAGNSLAAVIPIATEVVSTLDDKKALRYGYDTTSFSDRPVLSLSSTLADIASALPIHILPGETDPAGVLMPQQPFPRAMFGDAALYQTFSCETNPTYLTIASDTESDSSSKPKRAPIRRNVLVNSGQPLNDMFKYLPSPPNTRLSLLESTLKWRHMAPTAPDTLWCHPYFGEDPFLIPETPDIYIVGGQNRFSTKLVEEQRQNSKTSSKETIRCRIVMVPSFAETGILVLVNLRTLAVKRVNFSAYGMAAGGEAEAKEEPSPRATSPILNEPMQSAPKSSLEYDLI